MLITLFHQQNQFFNFRFIFKVGEAEGGEGGEGTEGEEGEEGEAEAEAEGGAVEEGEAGVVGAQERIRDEMVLSEIQKKVSERSPLTEAEIATALRYIKEKPAILKGALFPEKMNLSGADFSGADLSGADLFGANLLDTDFLGAKLAGTCFCHATL